MDFNVEELESEFEEKKERYFQMLESASKAKRPKMILLYQRKVKQARIDMEAKQIKAFEKQLKEFRKQKKREAVAKAEAGQYDSEYKKHIEYRDGLDKLHDDNSLFLEKLKPKLQKDILKAKKKSDWQVSHRVLITIAHKHKTMFLRRYHLIFDPVFNWVKKRKRDFSDFIEEQVQPFFKKLLKIYKQFMGV